MARFRLSVFLWLLICIEWTESDSPYHNSNCADNRVVIVHLFEWKWSDVAAECERFLGPRGYCGVQVSPPGENVIVESPMRPWWERYQPVSYGLTTRSGTETEFVDMVRRCNLAGVRIYVDAILNHMSGMGRRGIGTGGCEFDADLGYFPCVPYSMPDFNDCTGCDGCCCINSWMDHAMVRNCRLVGLIDLNQALPHTQNMLVDYINRLIDYGVAGFRFDAAKHMWPEDLQVIFDRMADLNTEYFPSGSRPFVYQEVIDLNQNGEVNVHMYKHLGRVTEFRYCTKVREASGALWSIPGLYDPGWGMLESGDAFTFVDNHDNQRGHGAGGDVLTFKQQREYQIAQAISLGWPYGYPRVMSSYDFTNTDEGPPHDGNYNTADVIINSDGTCGGGWICEHRWLSIAGMAGFAKAVQGTGEENWWTSGNKAAWSRGNKGFVAITNEGGMNENLYTGLPSGDYCNVIQGCPTSSGCEGGTVNVDSGGRANIVITDNNVPILAIHVDARAGSGSCTGAEGGPAPTQPPSTTTPSTTTTFTAAPTGSTTTGPSTTTTPPGPEDWRRTVVYIFFQSQPGQDLFLRGGIDGDIRPGCGDAATSECSIRIDHNQISSETPHYDKYNDWRAGDNHLDWFGAEPGQGSFMSRPAQGTPAVWTTNVPGQDGYQPDNSFGQHYWKVDFNMDCSEAENGWFEFKGYIDGFGAGWEPNIAQATTCSGTAAGSSPYTTTNHMGRCGHFNVFQWGSGSCQIDSF